MASPSSSQRARAPSPEHTTPSERVISVNSDSPALMRGASVQDAATDDEDALDEEEDESDNASGLADLELHEHEYHRGRQAIPMQSPGDLLEISLDDVDETDGRRRRRRLPSLRKRHFFEGNDLRASGRGRMMQRITFRRRKAGEHDVFWTGIFLSNVLSLALMVVLMFYLLQTDFFESHQNELFGTTVDNRFTVVSPENADAKIYLKSGYSTSRYSEAMLSFGNGELKIGRRALAPTDVQGFYGVSIANNGSTVFTNKLNAPFVKTDYLHAARAVVFNDGTVMTTAANLSGGISEVGDLNLISKTGSITLSAGGKPVVKIDPDATVNLLNVGKDDIESSGISFSAASGDISVSSTFKIHHDENATLISSANAIELNSTKLVVGSPNASETVITVPGAAKEESATSANAFKQISLAILGQSSANQSHGGDVVVRGGDGFSRGGDIVLSGGESESDDGDVTRGTILINAKLPRTTMSTTEIGTHSKSHKVNLHGKVSINNASESGHGTSLYIGGGNILATSKNISVNNMAANGSAVAVKSRRIDLQASKSASLTMDANSTHLVGSKSLLIAVEPKTNSSHSTSISMDNEGQVALNASRSIHLSATGANSSIVFIGSVRFGDDSSGEDDSDSAADLAIDDGTVAIDADSVAVGAAGNTDTISLMSDEISIGNSTQTSMVKIAGENASILCKHVNVGTTASNVLVSGQIVDLHASDSPGDSTKSATLSMRGGSVSVSGSDVILGDKNSQSVTVGSPSTGHVSITSEAVEVGVSAKMVSVGDKATTVTIGSEASSVDIRGKLTVNGKAFEARRQLEASDTTFYAIARSDGVVLEFQHAGSEIHVPVSLTSNSNGAVADTSGDVQLVDSSATAGTTHLRLGLSLTSIRLRVDSEVTETSGRGRSPKLRCRLYNMKERAHVVLEVVSQLETCEGTEDCNSGYFLGASTQRIVPIQPRDRLSLMCAASPLSVNSKGIRIVLVGSVQLDVSSL